MRLVLILLAIACLPKNSTVETIDYGPLVAQAVQTGAALAAIQQVNAVEREDYAACLVYSGITTALNAGTSIILVEADARFALPAVDLDISDCLALGESPDGVDIAYLDLLADLALGGVEALLISYADATRATACESWLRGALVTRYARGVVTAVATELSNPDGKVQIPAVSSDLAECLE